MKISLNFEYLSVASAKSATNPRRSPTAVEMAGGILIGIRIKITERRSRFLDLWNRNLFARDL